MALIFDNFLFGYSQHSGRGSSSVLFAYSFLLLFGQFDNIYKVEHFFFLEGGFKGIYLREKNFTLSYVVSEI